MTDADATTCDLHGYVDPCPLCTKPVLSHYDDELGRWVVGSSQAVRDVIDERQRQIVGEEFDAAHDDAHANGEIARAAACYASPVRVFKAVEAVGRAHESYVVYRDLWPWADKWWKPKLDRRSNLVKAGALILAEIDRIDRAVAKRSVPK